MADNLHETYKPPIEGIKCSTLLFSSHCCVPGDIWSCFVRSKSNTEKLEKSQTCGCFKDSKQTLTFSCESLIEIHFYCSELSEWYKFSLIFMETLILTFRVRTLNVCNVCDYM